MQFKRKHLYSLFLILCLALTYYPVRLVSSASNTWQVGQSSDDAFRQYSSSQWSTTAWLEVGWYDTQYHGTHCGMRFMSINIPQGATILSANFTGRARETKSTGVVRSRIKGEDIDDSSTFTTEADFIARDRTSAIVDWDGIEAFILGTWYTSPDITTIIQEIVDRGGWVSGNNLTIFWDDEEDRSDHTFARHRQFNSWDENPDWAIKLLVEWEPPPRYITFYNNIGGKFLYNSTISNNVSEVPFDNGTVLTLIGAPDGNLTYGFDNFTWDASSTYTNVYNLTLTSNLTIWCYFGEFEGGVSPPTGVINIGRNTLISIIFVFVVFGVVIFLVGVKKKKRR